MLPDNYRAKLTVALFKNIDNLKQNAMEEASLIL